MKHNLILILVVILIMISGCQNIELTQSSAVNYKNCTSSLLNSTKVTTVHLDTYLKVCKGITETRCESITIDPILNETDTVMYLVNYPEGGWEVLSADIRAPKVMVMCEEGNITIEELASNTAEEYLYDAMGNLISYLHNNPEIDIEYEDNWNDITYQIENNKTREIESWVLIGTNVLTDTELKQDHLLNTKWGVGDIYYDSKWNINAPRVSTSSLARCPVGSIPVAVSQILYYLHYKLGTPATFCNDFEVGTYISNDQSYAIILPYEIWGSQIQSDDWNNMPLEFDTDLYTDEQYKLVSSLMVYAGYSMQAVYTPDRTMVQTNKIKPFFTSQGINCSSPSSFNWEIVSDEIFDRQMPVMVEVYTNNNYSEYTIIDGILYYLKEVEKRYVWNSISGPKYKTVIETDSKNMVCFNWGLSGRDSYEDGETKWYNMYAAMNVGFVTYIGFRNMIYNFTD